jgi:hypothetical protein
VNASNAFPIFSTGISYDDSSCKQWQRQDAGNTRQFHGAESPATLWTQVRLRCKQPGGLTSTRT